MSCPDAVETQACLYLQTTGKEPNYIRMGPKAHCLYLGCLLERDRGTNVYPKSQVPLHDKRIFQTTRSGRVEIILDPTLDPDEVLACG